MAEDDLDRLFGKVEGQWKEGKAAGVAMDDLEKVTAITDFIWETISPYSCSRSVVHFCPRVTPRCACSLYECRQDDKLRLHK